MLHACTSGIKQESALRRHIQKAEGGTMTPSPQSFEHWVHSAVSGNSKALTTRLQHMSSTKSGSIQGPVMAY